MRCIFCKKDSNSSRSIEHIIPESLGNTLLVLPMGIVCDSCNNYFASKVERPFLESDAIHQLRFHQAVPNKKGRFPHISGKLAPDLSATVHRDSKTGIPFIIVEPDAFEHMLAAQSGTLIIPGGTPVPQGMITSRFLAKVAFEAMAERLKAHPDGLEYLVNETQFDPIRNHARKGDLVDWPVNIRVLYDADKKWIDEKGEEVQTVHETDILHTPQGEYYFVMAIFGIEFAINYGGPQIEGYREWLNNNNGESPLYSFKNSTNTRL